MRASASRSGARCHATSPREPAHQKASASAATSPASPAPSRARSRWRSAPGWRLSSRSALELARGSPARSACGAHASRVAAQHLVRGYLTLDARHPGNAPACRRAPPGSGSRRAAQRCRCAATARSARRWPPCARATAPARPVRRSPRRDLGVHDAHLDGSPARLQAHVPPQERRLGKGAAAQQQVDALDVVVVVREGAWEPDAGKRPEHRRTRRCEPGLPPLPEGGVRRQRQQQRQMPAQPVHRAHARPRGRGRRRGRAGRTSARGARARAATRTAVGSARRRRCVSPARRSWGACPAAAARRPRPASSVRSSLRSAASSPIAAGTPSCTPVRSSSAEPCVSASTWSAEMRSAASAGCCRSTARARSRWRVAASPPPRSRRSTADDASGTASGPRLGARAPRAGSPTQAARRVDCCAPRRARLLSLLGGCHQVLGRGRAERGHRPASRRATEHRAAVTLPALRCPR